MQDPTKLKELEQASGIKGFKRILSAPRCAETPLHCILEEAGQKEKAEMLLTLLTSYAATEDLNAQNTEGNTALHCAILQEDILCAKVLIAFGIDINSANHNGHTPLDLAMAQVRAKNGCHIMKDILLSSMVPPTGGRDDISASWMWVEVAKKVSTAHHSQLVSSHAVAKHSVVEMYSHQDGTKEEGGCVEVDKMLQLLYKVGCKSGAAEPQRREFPFVPDLVSLVDSGELPDLSGEEKVRMDLEDSLKLTQLANPALLEMLEDCINKKLENGQSLVSDEALAMLLQHRELGEYKLTAPRPGPHLKGGSRILCLDGGGMKGLAQIEVLCQLEVATGQKITELFDWIVGTSTGAIIALALVYANMSLAEIRRLYFNMKEKIFGKGRHNSEALEVILKETFGMRAMEDVKSPKVMIGAVNKDTTNLQLQFFNNCLDDSYSKQPVWKVARYTSAAPMFFTEFENYVDGGVLANNPCEYALTAIQKFYREQKMRPQVSLLVSVGSGVYPALKLGNIDAQKFLYFGIHTFRLDILRDRATNLISLLSNALVESEAVAKNCKSRCEEQGILFYRFSPKLDEVIAAGETDNERLVNMLIKTRLQLKEQGLQDLANLIVRNRDLNKLY